MALAAKARLGPYEVLDPVGSGGMGEVWRARDTRLGRLVALKVLPARFAESPGRLLRLEREARLLAALNHPHIATLYGFEEGGGTSALVMELVEGASLAARLEAGPLALEEALELGRQIAEALEAAHERGILHRDLKPANVRLTEKGQVKLLDFGLAKALQPVEAEGAAEPSTLTTEDSPVSPGTGVAGTAPYMSPEQARGEEVDRRSDLWAFGCVLFEMLTGRRAYGGKSQAEAVAAVLEREPDWGALPRGTPAAVVRLLERCLRKRREERLRDAGDARLELEDLLRGGRGRPGVWQVEERSPYPGLQPFGEQDAGVFFGREAEVKALWGRIRAHRLLAVIGPSGVGKSSFLRAGLIPAHPEGWAAVCATPGASPALGLARALTPELAGNAAAISEMLAGVTELFQTGESDRIVAAVRRWRSRHSEALLVVDQFEELFTLNPSEVQARFAALLGRLAHESDIHLLLSLRDDFLMCCHEQPALAHVFTELTPLGTLTRDGLRSALVEPARKRGYSFENEALVEEMVSAVAGGRGALPLLAFAVARLWEKRDRERKLLSRGAYEEIGGVAGALAQHAEVTMDRIGAERQTVVREIFRNLVTGQGTRAVADREELLSAFPGREAAEEVLQELIDARLVTSYGMDGEEGQAGHHRVEVVHESLLVAWPRLVRWQAQDEEGALLRDQLRQAAHLWEQKGRTSDLVWTGTAYREFELWRERYTGALTALEEDFARAMAEKARRRKRLIEGAVASVIVILAGVAIAVTASRHQAVLAREHAEAEARRAEASKVLALSKLELDRYPTAALAYARKSLDLADTAEARRFALEVLWHAPVARRLSLERLKKELGVPDIVVFEGVAFSPDGRWLAAQSQGGWVLLAPRDRDWPRALPGPPDNQLYPLLGFGPRSDLLVTSGRGLSVRFVSVPDLREVRSIDLGGVESWGEFTGDGLVTVTKRSPSDTQHLIRVWPLAGGAPRTVAGRFEPGAEFTVDSTVTRLARGRGREILLRDLDSSRSGERAIGRVGDALVDLAFVGRGEGLVSMDKSGEVRLWPLEDVGRPRILGTYPLGGSLSKDAQGRYLALARNNAEADVWDLLGPPDAEPVVLKTSDIAPLVTAAFDSNGPWLATNFDTDNVAFWPLASPSVRILRGGRPSWNMAFSPDSRWLASCAGDHARLWPLAAAGMHTLLPALCYGLAAHPAGMHLLVGTFRGEALLYPVAGGPPRRLRTGWEDASNMSTFAIAFDAGGRRVAACPMNENTSIKDPNLRVLRIWDLESGEARTYSLAHLTDASWVGFVSIRFAADGGLYVAGQGGVSRLTLPTAKEGTVSSETLYKAVFARLDLSRDGRRLVILATSQSWSPSPLPLEELVVFDLATGTSHRITTHGKRLDKAALDATGRFVVTGDADGVVRVGPVTGEEPHLLLGCAGPVSEVAVSPDGRWVAAADGSGLRLWPLPDMTKPPLHTLPHDALLATLDSLTNLRVVPDPSSSTGWKLDIGPFPGWKDVPTW